MTNTENYPPIGPVISDNAAKLIDAAIAVGSTYDLVSMRDHAEVAVTAATALFEALGIETQGGAGAAEDGYRPADRSTVLATVRRHLARAVASRLSWYDNDGGARPLWTR